MQDTLILEYMQPLDYAKKMPIIHCNDSFQPKESATPTTKPKLILSEEHYAKFITYITVKFQQLFNIEIEHKSVCKLTDKILTYMCLDHNYIIYMSILFSKIPTNDNHPNKYSQFPVVWEIYYLVCIRLIHKMNEDEQHTSNSIAIFIQKNITTLL